MKNSKYFKQAELLIQVMPYVNMEKCFALKGGTAINLFIRNIPRLSVDIDLTYLLIEDRETTLRNISDALLRIADRIRIKLYGSKITSLYLSGSNHIFKLVVERLETKIIIEPNLILRGSVFPPELRALSSKAEKLFEQSVSTQVMSVADVYGGKICAALDRQHPRDLFDVKILFENEGITEEIRKAFIVYLISNSRPINELLNPNRLDIRSAYSEEFETMTEDAITYNALIETREHLISSINSELTGSEREFLISVKQGIPNWTLLNLPNIEHLPSIKWKIINIGKMDPSKHKRQLESLKRVLAI